MDCSLLARFLLSMGFSMTRILEWVAIFYSRGSSCPRDQTHISLISCIGKWILHHLGNPVNIVLLRFYKLTHAVYYQYLGFPVFMLAFFSVLHTLLPD